MSKISTAMDSKEGKGRSILAWAYEKGKQLLYKASCSDVEQERRSAPIKKDVILPPKSSEPVKWPLPAKK